MPDPPAPDALQVVVEDAVEMTDRSQPPASVAGGALLPPPPRARFSVSQLRLSVSSRKPMSERPGSVSGPAPLKVGEFAVELSGFFTQWGRRKVELLPDGSLIIIKGRTRTVGATPPYLVRYTLDENLPEDAPTFEIYRQASPKVERQLLHLCAYTDEDRQAWIQALLQLQVGDAGLAGSAAGGGSVDASQSI